VTDDADPALDLAVELARPNMSRVHDYLLGGGAHLEPDRRLGARMTELDPGVITLVRATRAFLRRAVRYCAQEGIRQFLDLGSGIPTVGHVHQVARAADPRCRIAYVGAESVAVEHGRHLLRYDPLATVTRLDPADPDAVLAAPGVTGLLDLRAPVALLALTMLQYDLADPAGLLARYTGRLAPGSAVVLAHLSAEHTALDIAGLAELSAQTGTPARPRSRAEIAALLGRAEPVDPGLVPPEDWRPDDPYAAGTTGVGGSYVAVARIR
jgi:S-adenosyl methyltransferase